MLRNKMVLGQIIWIYQIIILSRHHIIHLTFIYLICLLDKFERKKAIVCNGCKGKNERNINQRSAE